MQNRDSTRVPKEYKEWSLDVDPELLRVLRGRYNPEAGNRAFAQALGAASTDAALSEIGRLLGYSCFTPEKAPTIMGEFRQNIWPEVQVSVAKNKNKDISKIKVNKGSVGAPAVIQKIWQTAGIRMDGLPQYVFAIAELWMIELVKSTNLSIEDFSLDLLIKRELGGHHNPFCLAVNGKKEVVVNRRLLATDALHHRNSLKTQQSRELKFSSARKQYPNWDLYQSHFVEILPFCFADYVAHGQKNPEDFWNAIARKFERSYEIIEKLALCNKNAGIQYIAYAIEDGNIKRFECFQRAPNLDQLSKLTTSGTTSLNWGALFRTGADGIPRVVDQLPDNQRSRLVRGVEN